MGCQATILQDVSTLLLLSFYSICTSGLLTAVQQERRLKGVDGGEQLGC